MANSPDFDPLGTVTTPVSVDVSRLDLCADYFSSPIALELLVAHYQPTQILHADPLIIKIAGNAHLAVFRFGAVVFWQCDEITRAKALLTIQRLPDISPPNEDVRDRLTILLHQPEERVNFREILLQALTLEHIKIISETLGQSVALKYSELSVSRTMRSTAPIVEGLETRGALHSSAKNIKRTVGFTLSIREATLAKFGLFDAPAETWQSERLARLHTMLYDHFDIKKRLEALHEKVTFLSDLNLILLNLLQNRTSHRLELIVILLIVIEVIFSLIHFFAPSP